MSMSVRTLVQEDVAMLILRVRTTLRMFEHVRPTSLLSQILLFD